MLEPAEKDSFVELDILMKLTKVTVVDFFFLFYEIVYSVTVTFSFL